MLFDALLTAYGFKRSQRDPGVYFRDHEMVCVVCPGEGRASYWLYFRDCLEISAVSGHDTAGLRSAIGVAAPTALAA